MIGTNAHDAAPRVGGSGSAMIGTPITVDGTIAALVKAVRGIRDDQ